MTISLSGLGTGFDALTLVRQIIAAERQPISILYDRVSLFQNRISAFENFSNYLSDFESKVDNLNKLSTLASRTVTVSDENILTATATQDANVGTYAIDVLTLAQAESHTSAGFADIDNVSVGTGTFQIQVGSGENIEITIDSTNNTLDGLRQAINDSGADVTATIINNGDPSNPYQIVVTSNETGTANNITIDDSGLSGGQALNFTKAQDAANATLTINGIDIVSSTNTVDEAIQGVSISLLSASPGEVIELTVAHDKETVKTALNEFIDSYNTLADFFREQFAYDEASGSAGVLAGNAAVRNIKFGLARILTGGVEGSSGDFTVLAQIGVESDYTTGKLSLDATKFDEAFDENPNELLRLLMPYGSTTDARVSFVSGSTEALPGNYAISVTQAAEQAQVSGDQDVRAQGISQDETLTVTMGEQTVEVNLESGDRVEDIVAKINSVMNSEGVGISASMNGQTLVLTSDGYGEDISFSVVSDQASSSNSSGIGTSGKSDAGVDIAGMINGHEAEGIGRILTGAEGYDEEGLKVAVSGSALGDYGTIDYSVGIAAQLEGILGDYTDPVDGTTHQAIDSLESQKERVEDQIDRMEDRLLTREEFLLKKFFAAERALSELQVLSSAIAGQSGLFAGLF